MRAAAPRTAAARASSSTDARVRSTVDAVAARLTDERGLVYRYHTAAGVDGLEHCGFWVAEGVRADQELIDRIAERGITVCPTLGLLPGSSLPPPVASRIQAMSASIGRLHKAGVRLVGGTDAGIAPAKPHGVARYVADHLLMTGLTAVEALRAVTSAGADACGLGGRKGRLVSGADADILAVAGNPLVDPQALRQTAAVFRAGVQVPTPMPG
ncbi:MAG: amidohydrolase family protein [Actinobacteria bacterium]|nr:amidohydrolase family protein [Actinomycetota bacterium]